MGLLFIWVSLSSVSVYYWYRAYIEQKERLMEEQEADRKRLNLLRESFKKEGLLK